MENKFLKLSDESKRNFLEGAEASTGIKPYLLEKDITHIFEQMIFHALAEEYIGESKAAELMNMPLESFRYLRALESQDVARH